jgi:hypothetical protein
VRERGKPGQSRAVKIRGKGKLVQTLWVRQITQAYKANGSRPEDKVY